MSLYSILGVRATARHFLDFSHYLEATVFAIASFRDNAKKQNLKAKNSLFKLSVIAAV